MENIKKQRASRWNKAMIEELVGGFEARSEVLLQKKVCDRVNEMKIRMWKEIASGVEQHNDTGSSKTWQECRVKFTEMKSRAKKKEAECRKETKKTGGGSSIAVEGTSIEKKLLSVLSEVEIGGMTGNLETGVSKNVIFYLFYNM